MKAFVLRTVLFALLAQSFNIALNKLWIKEALTGTLTESVIAGIIVSALYAYFVKGKKPKPNEAKADTFTPPIATGPDAGGHIQ